MEIHRDEQLIHLRELKMCEKAYSAASIVLLFSHIPYVIAALFITLIALLTQANEMLFYFLEGVVIAGSLAVSLYGLTTKEIKYSAFGSIIMVLNSITATLVASSISHRYDLMFVFAVINYLLSFISVAATSVNLIAGVKYHELEQCEGFPYFNSLSSRLKEKADEPKDYEYYRKMHRAREEFFTKDETANGTTGGSKGEMSEITIDTAADTTANGTGASQGTMDDI